MSDDPTPGHLTQARLGTMRLGATRLDLTFEKVLEAFRALSAERDADRAILTELRRRLDEHDRQLAALRPGRRRRVRKLNQKKRSDRATMVAAVDRILTQMPEPDLDAAIREHLDRNYRDAHPGQSWQVHASRDDRAREVRNLRRRYHSEKAKRLRTKKSRPVR